YNSLQNGEESSNTSATVLNFLNNFLEKIETSFRFEGNFIRKLAHFIEFFILGFFVMLTFESFTGKTIRGLGYPLFLCLLVPVLDEYIQTFSEGRTSLVTDVLLDFSGAFSGIIFAIILIFIKRKFFYKTKYKYGINYRFNL
ncbi:MAG: VanZ family protein, partial [Eubacteriales bacterium]|nr:VanZ family protein [Eubacteriales bacterium]